MTCILTIVKTTVPIVILVPHAAQIPNQQHALCSVCVQNLVQMNLGHPVTLVWMSFDHPVLLAWRQVSVEDSVECFDDRGTPISIRSLVVAVCMISVVSEIYFGSDRSCSCSSVGPPGGGWCTVCSHLAPAEVSSRLQ